MDHESYLGDTLASIACEKAGILKPGVPAVIGGAAARGAGGDRGAGRRDRRAARCCRAATGTCWPTATGLRGRGHERRLELPRPALAGHSPDRQCRARCRRRRCSWAMPCLDAAAIGRGLREARWPARLQRLAAGPLVAPSRPAPRSGSTAATIRPPAQVLAESLPGLLRRAGRCISWSACSPPRISAQFLAPLLPLAASLRFVPIAGRGAWAAIPRPRPRRAALLGARAAAAGSVAEAVRGHRRGRSGALRHPDLRLALSRGRGPARQSLNSAAKPLRGVGVVVYIRVLSPPGRWVWRVGFVVSDAGARATVLFLIVGCCEGMCRRRRGCRLWHQMVGLAGPVGLALRWSGGLWF